MMIPILSEDLQSAFLPNVTVVIGCKNRKHYLKIIPTSKEIKDEFFPPPDCHMCGNADRCDLVRFRCQPDYPKDYKVGSIKRSEK